FAEILMEAAEGNLSTVPTVDDDAMVTVVLASAGYPSKPTTGHVILGV
ncbi:MAG TPA: phosphoribosylamine--glycine ligase, partial [Acidimicrobiaceae bacterium]|nr:phosphoribosylamine--glycine ligase [Acidimicrobiaceae bacterium]